IKQRLRIKSFYGTSENAVKTQIWIAVSVYVLVAIVRKRLGLEISLYQILQILSVMLFEKTPILQALKPPDSQNDLLDSSKQLIMFELEPDSCAAEHFDGMLGELQGDEHPCRVKTGWRSCEWRWRGWDK